MSDIQIVEEKGVFRFAEGLVYELGNKEMAALNKTLIIGCGGCGASIVRAVKKGISARFSNASQVTHFLVIDTDKKAFDPIPGSREQDLEPDEICLLQGSNAWEMWRIKVRDGIIDKMIPQRGIFPANVQGLSSGTGAGQRRACGKLALLCDYRNVMEHIRRQLVKLTGLRGEGAEGRDLNVIVVSSFCGGTGSGIFIDVAVLARMVIERLLPHAPVRLKGYFSVISEGVKNSCQEDEQEIIRVNTYAALKELQFLQDQEKEDRQSQDTTGSRSARAAFQYGPGADRYDLQEPLFHEAYLVQGENMSGRFDKFGEVNQLIARFLTVTITSPEVAAGIESVKRNDGFLQLQNMCILTNKSVTLLALSACSLHLEHRNLFYYCTLTHARGVADGLQGSGDGSVAIENDVIGFLQANEMEERGLKQNQFIQKLLRAGKIDPGRFYHKPPDERMGVVKQAAEYHEALEGFGRQLPAIAERLQKTADEQGDFFAKCRQAMVDQVDKEFKEKGARPAIQFVTELKRVFSVVDKEFENEIKTFDETHLGDDVARKLSEIKDYEGMVGALRNVFSHVPETNIAFIRDNYNRYVEDAIQTAAKRVLRGVIGKLAVVLDDQLKALGNVRDRLETLQQGLKERCDEIRDELARTKAFSLDISCAVPELLRTVYEEVPKRSPREIAGGIGATRAKGGQPVQENWVELFRGKEWRQIGDLFLNDCAEVFREPVRNKANVTEFVRQVLASRSSDEEDRQLRQYVLKSIDDLARFSKPFWNLVLPVDRKNLRTMNPNFVLYIGINPPKGVNAEDHPVAQIIKRKLEESEPPHNYNPIKAIPVQTSYEAVIDVVGVASAARAFYLSVADQYKKLYENWIKQPNNAYPHVFPEEFAERIPDLFAGATGDGVAGDPRKAAFALAMAYGYISASSPTVFYWNLDKNGKYISSSVWKTIPADIDGLGPLSANTRGLLENRISDEGRKNAFEVWCDNYSGEADEVMRLVYDKIKQERVATLNKIKQYVEQVLDPKIRNSGKGELRDQLILEKNLVEAFLSEVE